MCKSRDGVRGSRVWCGAAADGMRVATDAWAPSDDARANDDERTARDGDDGRTHLTLLLRLARLLAHAWYAKGL